MNKHRDYRYQLAAVNFLSNISLDGTYQDTNFAYLFENKLKNVDKPEEQVELTPNKPDVAIAESSPSVTTDEEVELPNAAFTPDESVFLGKRLLILSGFRHSVLSVLSALPFSSQKNEPHHADGPPHRGRRVSSGSLTLREAIYKIGSITQFHEDMSFSHYLQPVLFAPSPPLHKISRGYPHHSSRVAATSSFHHHALDVTTSTRGAILPPGPNGNTNPGRMETVTSQRHAMITDDRVRYTVGTCQLSPHEMSSSVHPHTTSLSSDNIVDIPGGAFHKLGESSCLGADIPAGSSHLMAADVFKSSMPSAHKEYKSVSGMQSPVLHHQQQPLLLDDPEMTGGRHKTVLKLPFYSTTIMEYVKSSDLKRDLNLQFRERYPHIQISLTKIRSIKSDILHIAKRLAIDLWIVGQTYVLFERLVYKGVVNKTNRKICCGMVFLLTAKINDIKGAELNDLREELESYVKVTAHEMLLYELATLLALEFSLLALDADILAHLQRILPSAGQRKQSGGK